MKSPIYDKIAPSEHLFCFQGDTAHGFYGFESVFFVTFTALLYFACICYILLILYLSLVNYKQI